MWLAIRVVGLDGRVVLLLELVGHHADRDGGFAQRLVSAVQREDAVLQHQEVARNLALDQVDDALWDLCVADVCRLMRGY